MAGRIETARDGVLQSRKLLRTPWSTTAPFARRGTEPIRGRGDSA